MECTSLEDLCNTPLLGDSCCNTDFFSWADPGILRNVVFMVCAGFLYMAILFMIEFRVFDGISYKCKPKSKGLTSNTTATDVNAVDSDVLEEKSRVRNMTYDQLSAKNLVVRNMTKYYKDFLAVNQISVAVDP